MLSCNQVTGTRIPFKRLCPSPSWGPPTYRPITPTLSHSQQESQPPCAWQPWGQLLLCAGWGNWADREAHCLYPLGLYCWGLLPGRSPKTLSCCPASSGFRRWRRCGCADKQPYPEEWITSLVLLIRTRRLREAEGLCAERLSQVRAAGRGWAVGVGDLEAERSCIALGRKCQGQNIRARPHLASGDRDPRAQTLAQLGSRSHSHSASESARKPGVPSSQDLPALGPRRQAGRPGAGYNVTPPPRAGRLLPFQFCDQRPSP